MVQITKTPIIEQVSKETLVDLLKMKYGYSKIGKILGMTPEMVQYACLIVYKIDTVKTKHYLVHEKLDELIEEYSKGASLYKLADTYKSNDAYIKKVLTDIGVPARGISEALQASGATKGENHYAWNPKLAEDERLQNRGLEYKQWAYKVKEQYAFKCDCCGKGSNGDMVSHHLHNYKDFPASRYDIDNGVCLCVKCHIAFHVKYGKRFNNVAQYTEFKGAKNGN